MGKLFNLQDWLTLDDAAKYLSGAIDEQVTIGDILRLGLDGKLTLSVNFVNGTTAQRKVRIHKDDARTSEGISFNGEPAPFVIFGDWIDDEYLLDFPESRQVISISGIWDLLMIGNERLDVNHQYLQLINGPELDLTCIDGTFVVSGDRRHYFSLCEPSEYPEIREPGADVIYMPAGGLPNDSMLVVRKVNLDAVIEIANGPTKSIERPLEERERKALVAIIAVLCREAKLDYGKPSKTADLIEGLAMQMGVSLSKRAIEGHLKKIPDALAGRMK